ncbi:MAG: hypothetical protein L3J12_10645 [Spirochaetales bacterium]|nr:hypothetical protein [Spirochaetales bacterium]
MNSLIKELLDEYSLEIGDIRWMLANRLTESILSNNHDPEELTNIIWKGELESDLYNMEERFLNDMEFQLEREIIDEAWIRGNLAEASELKCIRRSI